MTVLSLAGTLGGLPRRVLRFLRHLPDRLLHPVRRRRVQKRLRRNGPPRDALFICLGNINRSPFAAAAFGRAAEELGLIGIEVRSAGFIGPGRPSPDVAQALASARGLDLGPHVSRTFDGDELRGTDLVVVMDPRQRRKVCRLSGRPHGDVVVLGDLDPASIVRRTIQDPYGHPQEVFERVFTRIERCIGELAGAFVYPEPPRSEGLSQLRESR